MVVVLFRVMLRGLFRVLSCKYITSVREMSMIARRFVVTGFMMLCRFLMMARGVLVMLGRLGVMLSTPESVEKKRSKFRTEQAERFNSVAASF